MNKIKVMLVDDHTVVRKGLRTLLEADNSIEVVGEAENGRQALQLLGKLRPEVILMDIAMPQLNGVEATRQILKEMPSVKILMLSAYSDDHYVQSLVQAGASGYLVKHTSANDLLKAIHEVKNGNAFFSPAISRQLADQYRETSYPPGKALTVRCNQLTSREQEVLQLIAESKPNKQIAAELCISIKTVEKHRQGAMNKLNIHDIAGLTRYAMSKGIIETCLDSESS